MARPEIGGRVTIRLGPLKELVDEYAAEHRIKRPEAARRLIAAGLRQPESPQVERKP